MERYTATGTGEKQAKQRTETNKKVCSYNVERQNLLHKNSLKVAEQNKMKSL